MIDQKEKIVDYLCNKIPGYPYDEIKDSLFIDELLEDFSDIDHLEELKKFRIWLFDTGINIRSFRVIIRKWFKRVSSRTGSGEKQINRE